MPLSPEIAFLESLRSCAGFFRRMSAFSLYYQDRS